MLDRLVLCVVACGLYIFKMDMKVMQSNPFSSVQHHICGLLVSYILFQFSSDISATACCFH